MTTMKAISAALKLIDVKRENLRKAFQDLEAHSSSLSSFTLTWSDLDSHFTSLQSDLQHKFRLLQTLESQPPPSKPPPIRPSSSVQISTNSVRARPELKSLCQKMDGLGLRKYIIARPKERDAIRVELFDALESAPDAAAMVLDAMEGFSSVNDLDMRRACVILLEELMELRLGIKGEVRERAMKLAVEWKTKMGGVNNNTKNTFEVLGFLLLVAVYGLMNGFSMVDLINYTVIVAKNKIAVRLCRMLKFGDQISDLIKKLVSSGKPILAIKFIFEFEMTDKYPPVTLLKAYAKESKDLILKIRKSGSPHGQAMKDATTKELNDLKSIIKCIEDYKLESQYPKNILLKRIEKLEKEKQNKKRAAAPPVSMPEQQSKPHKDSIFKHSRTIAPADPATILRSDTVNLTTLENVAASSAIPLYQQPPLLAAGLLPDHPDPYFTSPPGTFGMAGSNSAIAPHTGSSLGFYEFGPSDPPIQKAGLLLDHPDPYFTSPGGHFVASSNPAITPYTGSSSGLYELGPSDPAIQNAGSSSGLYEVPGAPSSSDGNIPSTAPNLYPSGSHMPSGYFDGSVAYGGYGLPPEYHPSYYPR